MQQVPNEITASYVWCYVMYVITTDDLLTYEFQYHLYVMSTRM